MIDLSHLDTLPVEEKRDLLKSLLSLRASGPNVAMPLSYGQQALWFIYQLAPHSPAYNFLYAARIRTSLDLDVFRRACLALVARHPMLQTRFLVQDHKPMQQVDPTAAFHIELTDASTWSEEHLLTVLRQRADLPFNLEQAPCLRIELFQRGRADFALLMVFPHIIADLWSADLLLYELHQIYTTLRAGHQLKLPSVAARFGEFIRWQMMQAYGEQGQKSRAYWHNLLAGELPVLELPTSRPRPPVQTYNGTAYTWSLKPEITQQVRTLAREQGATPFSLLLSVFQLLMHRLSGQDDILVGTAVAGRDRPEWERVVGYFLNQVVFRTNFTANRSFRQLLDESRDQVYQALEHQAYPFGLLVKQLQPRRDPARSPIFQVMFIWDKPRDLDAAQAGLNGAAAYDLRLETLLMEQRGAPFDLTLILFEFGDRLEASFRYNTDLFDEADIQRWAGCFDTLLESVLTHPEALLSEVTMLTAAQRQQILVEWNQTQAPLPDCCFPQMFEQQAAQTPAAPALVFGDTTLSYDEANRRANQLARHLQKVGARPGDTMAISLPRGVDLILSVLASWKAGAAYLYIDPASPPMRRSDMLAEARPVVGIGLSSDPALTVPMVLLDSAWPRIQEQDDSNLRLAAGPEDRAYIIYTSGSTGRPKGAILRHGGLANLTLAQHKLFGLKSGDRVLQYASLGFDASVWEIVMTLSRGAALVLGDTPALLPGRPLWQLLHDQSITCATLPPSVLALVPTDPLPELHTLIVAGEACSAELLQTWAPGRRLFNAYGPTEVTVCATASECRADGQTPTIGKPIANTRVYVLDRHLEPVPPGVAGELYLAGPGLALGYIERPDLTAERFLPNPFNQADEAAMYWTGDIVRWTVDGELEFLGRADHQVKVRGCRIELEEIQGVLRHHPDVLDAVVIVQQGEDKSASPTRQQGLVAYVVPRSQAEFSLPTVRSYLLERLPHYMLPSAIVPLEAFPLSSTGKIDRARLPALARAAARPQTNGTPSTPTERLLMQVCTRVLMVDHVGLHDNFFEMGGASTQTLEVVALAREQGITLSPEMLFRYQTIAELAAAIDDAGGVVNGTAVRGEAVAPDHSPLATRHSPVPVLPSQLPGAVIESIGAYLPAQAVSTEQLLQGCRNKIDFPLEKLTGIRSRRMVSDMEFSIDLAAKAVADCLRRSAHRPEEVDLLICCNISRLDGPMYQFSLEPSTAARLAQRFGMVNALALDITNACAGTFTAILIADALLRQGIINTAMVASGEFITHLARTAQQEIEGYMDNRLACLTLGDSGMALMLERAPHTDVGFQDIELYTLGKYYDLCIAKLSSEPGGGPIMHTDAVTGTTVTIKQAVGHAMEVLRRKQWDLDEIDHLVMHQTSETTLDGAVREINRAVGKPVCHRGNTIYNVAERGNTATNTHFLAVCERIQAGDFEEGDRAIFAVSGSGQAVGTALYVFDSLPDRLRQEPRAPAQVGYVANEPGTLRHFPCQRRVRIESIGTLTEPPAQHADTATMLCQAGEACLQGSARPREEIDLILHTGVFRSEFISEPAVASIAAGRLAINHEEDRPSGRRTLAFDILNGGGGTLTACFLAQGMMAARKFNRVLLLASEVDHNRQFWPDKPLGLVETASALVLEESAGKEGFTAFGYRAFPEHVGVIVSNTGVRDLGPAVFHHHDPALDSILAQCIGQTVREFLARESLTLNDVRLVVPPQRPGQLMPLLAEELAVPLDRLVNLEAACDYYTSSLAYAFQRMRQDGRLPAGGPVLFIEVAAGLQVWCALYQS